MVRRNGVAGALVAWTLLGAGVAAAQTAGRVTGIGGVFVQRPHPAALAAWYRDMLGIKVESWGGAILRTNAAGHPPWRCGAPFRPAPTSSPVPNAIS